MSEQQAHLKINLIHDDLEVHQHYFKNLKNMSHSLFF